MVLTRNKTDLQRMLAGNFLHLTENVRNGEYKTAGRSKPNFSKTDEPLTYEYRDPWLINT
ncbi:hypothetical protein [Paraflavitalea speifideaquila]|uniref:hypothetical protein n=1 Tax=Paraflavitalea speifideaquila TaxID=3076558 RepID=UPI0028E2D0BB|nr:hypothetical protein [Paraflavitalea speifideiaquila]